MLDGPGFDTRFTGTGMKKARPEPRFMISRCGA